jgi:hypothetical protein
MIGAALEPSPKSVANVNPFSTMSVELARDLPGGATAQNLKDAQETIVSALNCGLTYLANSGPMITRIDSSSISEIVRASEALGETIRRTRDALLASSSSIDGTRVVQRVASDLTDEVVDGHGGARTDA